MDLGREGRIFGELVVVAANRLRCVLGMYRMGLQPKAFREQSNVNLDFSGRLALADAAEVQASSRRSPSSGAKTR